MLLLLSILEVRPNNLYFVISAINSGNPPKLFTRLCHLHLIINMILSDYFSASNDEIETLAFLRLFANNRLVIRKGISMSLCTATFLKLWRRVRNNREEESLLLRDQLMARSRC